MVCRWFAVGSMLSLVPASHSLLLLCYSCATPVAFPMLSFLSLIPADDHTPQPAEPPPPPDVEVSVQILRATGLASADFSFTGKGASDPFCEVHWKGEKLHATKVINNNLNPEWPDERCTVAVPPGGSTDQLVVSVWDSDGPLTKGDFLGQVTVPAAELLEPKVTCNM